MILLGLKNVLKNVVTLTVRKVSRYEVFSGQYFPKYGLNIEIYSINLLIQSKYGKIQTRKNSVLGHILRGDYLNYDASKIMVI